MIFKNKSLACSIEFAIHNASKEIAKRQLREDGWDDENVARLDIEDIIRRNIREA